MLWEVFLLSLKLLDTLFVVADQFLDLLFLAAQHILKLADEPFLFLNGPFEYGNLFSEDSHFLRKAFLFCLVGLLSKPLLLLHGPMFPLQPLKPFLKSKVFVVFCFGRML